VIELADILNDRILIVDEILRAIQAKTGISNDEDSELADANLTMETNRRMFCLRSSASRVEDRGIFDRARARNVAGGHSRRA
jgi:hypothetical protein